MKLKTRLKRKLYYSWLSRKLYENFKIYLRFKTEEKEEILKTSIEYSIKKFKELYGDNIFVYTGDDTEDKTGISVYYLEDNNPNIIKCFETIIMWPPYKLQYEG